MRAYYGRKCDIYKYLDTMENVGYWDDFSHRTDESTRELCLINVTIPLRFKLDEKIPALKIGKASKQYLLGFFNPIPEFIGEQPWLCIIYKRYDLVDGRFSQTFTIHTSYYRDDEEINLI